LTDEQKEQEILKDKNTSNFIKKVELTDEYKEQEILKDKNTSNFIKKVELTDEYKEQEILQDKNIPTAFETKFKDYVEKQQVSMINSDQQDKITNHSIMISQEESVKNSQREYPRNISQSNQQIIPKKFNMISRKKNFNPKNV
ncbi:hypothetical protein ABPG74_007961, partial [Tetrahymena malaccensis]